MPTKFRLAVVAVALLGGGLVAGAALSGGGAVAADTTPGTSSTAPAAPDGTTGKGGGPGRGGHEHTEVTGTELTKVKNAVKAYDSTITVKSVVKDPDGSYDVLGTKSSKDIALDVSKDLKTITERTGGPGGGHGGGPGGPGGSQDTPVTGTELTKVKDAVKAYDSTITVDSVRKDPDGSYDVLGTKDGSKVFLEVSKDLKTITENAGGPGGGHGGPGDHGPGGQAPGSSSDSGSGSGSGSTTTPSAARTA